MAEQNNVVLSKERENEIGRLFLKYKLLKEGFTFSGNLPREILNFARSADVQPEEALIFAEKMVRELTDDIFSKKSEK